VSIKFAFKIIAVGVELKWYSNIKGTNGTKSWVCGNTSQQYKY
jgi:hypothetical protein